MIGIGNGLVFVHFLTFLALIKNSSPLPPSLHIVIIILAKRPSRPAFRLLHADLSRTPSQGKAVPRETILVMDFLHFNFRSIRFDYLSYDCSFKVKCVGHPRRKKKMASSYFMTIISNFCTFLPIVILCFVLGVKVCFLPFYVYDFLFLCALS